MLLSLTFLTAKSRLNSTVESKQFNMKNNLSFICVRLKTTVFYLNF